jgi:hypothetical protein
MEETDHASASNVIAFASLSKLPDGGRRVYWKNEWPAPLLEGAIMHRLEVQ